MAKNGELLGIVGKNGAGKTTLFKCLSGLSKVTSGAVLLDNNNIYKQPMLLSNIGVLITPLYFDFLSVYDNIAYNLKLHGKYNKSTIIKTLNYVGLLNVISKKPKFFSYGMKQRLNLAICISTRPKILLLDEPFIGLDRKGVADLKILLKSWVEDNKSIVVISSHQIENLVDICSRFLLIDNGCLVCDEKIISNELTIVLNKPYEGLVTGDFSVEKNVLYTQLQGKALNLFLKKIIDEYIIINIYSKNKINNEF